MADDAPSPGKTNIADDLNEGWCKSEKGEGFTGQSLCDKILERLGPKHAGLFDEVRDEVVRMRAETIAEVAKLTLPKLGRRIGRGGFGFVYAATFQEQPVALKLLNPLLVREAGESSIPPQERFRREVEILENFPHPYLPTVHVSGDHKGQHYFVMQRGGNPLSDVANEAWDTATLLYFVKSLLEVLGHVHAYNIAHRDLKPANILVCRHGKARKPFPMLIDFGIAKDDHPDAPDTKTGENVGGGSDQFAHPRLHKLEDPLLADIYSFGCVLKHLLNPPVGDAPVKTPRLTSSPASPAERSDPDAAAMTDPDPDPIRHRLAEIAELCTEDTPPAGYGTAESLLAEIRQLSWKGKSEAVEPRPTEVRAAPEPVQVSAEPRPIALPGSGSIRMRRRLLWLGATILVAAGVFALGYAAAPDRRRDLAMLRAQTALDRGDVALDSGSPQDSEPNYLNAIEELENARKKWLDDSELASLLAQAHQKYGDYHRQTGDQAKAKAEYTLAIQHWESLIKRTASDVEDRWRAGLALAYGCRGDMHLQKSPRGHINPGNAFDDYETSNALREALAIQQPNNWEHQIQYARALSNFARLDASDSKWPESRNNWIKSLGILKTIRVALLQLPQRSPSEQIMLREALEETSASMLDHLNGYFVVSLNARLKADDLKSDFDFARMVCQDMQADPLAVHYSIALRLFQVKAGLEPDERTDSDFDRLQVHIESVSKVRARDWSKSLYIEMALGRPAESKLVNRASQYVKELPRQDYFFEEQCRRWEKQRTGVN